MARQQEVNAADHVRQSPPMVNPVAGDIEVIPALTAEKRKEIELDKFMSEVLTIRVEPPADENGEPMAEVGVNGRRLFIPRGIETNMGCDERGRKFPITRMYVERLARAKRVFYKQTLDQRLGEEMNRLQPQRALVYPFAVIDDPNPLGREWLKRVLAEV